MAADKYTLGGCGDHTQDGHCRWCGEKLRKHATSYEWPKDFPPGTPLPKRKQCVTAGSPSRLGRVLSVHRSHINNGSYGVSMWHGKIGVNGCMEFCSIMCGFRFGYWCRLNHVGLYRPEKGQIGCNRTLPTPPRNL